MSSQASSIEVDPNEILEDEDKARLRRIAEDDGPFSEYAERILKEAS